MKFSKHFTLALVIIFIAAGCNEAAKPEVTNPPAEQPAVESDTTIKFSDVGPQYKFSGKINSSWKAEYLPGIESINIYDPGASGINTLEQSQIFIRYFRANTFLTLATVDILNKEETKIGERSAVRYEIKKKAGVANFPSQPSWRNQQHNLIDIRHSQVSPSYFYVFAYNPSLPPEVFDEFINNLAFED